MKRHISKILLAASLVSFVGAVGVMIKQILGSTLFDLSYPHTFLAFFLLFAGLMLPCALPHHRPAGAPKIMANFSHCKKKLFLSCKQLPNQV